MAVTVSRDALRSIQPRLDAGDADVEPTEEELAQPVEDDEGGAFTEDKAKLGTKNLAERMSDEDRRRLGQQLLEEAQEAHESMSGWLKTVHDGLDEMAVDRGKGGAGSSPFPGASRQMFPLFAQASTNFAARAFLELCPPEGPIDVVPIGNGKDDKAEIERADRIKEYGNETLKVVMPEWLSETDKLFQMLPIEGSSFKKWWWDDGYNRFRCAYVPTERIIIPYDGGNVLIAPLVAEILEPKKYQVDEYVASGFWIEHEPTMAPIIDQGDATALKEARDSVIGDSEGAADNEELDAYRYYEIQVRRMVPEFAAALEDDQRPDEFDFDERPAEWLVTVDAGNSGAIVAVRPNWRMVAGRMVRRQGLIEYRMFPWAGSRGIGLFHLIGQLNKSATGALRALFDAAMRASMPGGWIRKGGIRDRGEITRGYGEYKEVDLGPMIDDIRKALMEDSFAGPHPVMSELLQWLSDAGQAFASVALQELGNATSTTPVGTTLARVEEGSKPFGAIFRRLHGSQAAEFREFYELSIENVDDAWLEAHFEQPSIRVEDLRPGVSVVPISDPRSFSQLQRTLRGELMVSFAEKANSLGVQVDLTKIFREVWDAANLPMSDEMFPEAPEPFNNQSPYVENAMLARGAPLAVNGEGDPHLLHLAAHLALLSVPGTSQSPQGQALAVHILEHLAVVTMMMPAEQGIGLYAETLTLMGQLIEPPDTEGVKALADAEMAKTSAKLVEIEAKREQDRERNQLEQDKIAFQAQKDIAIEREKHRQDMVEMEREYELKIKELQQKMQEAREDNASRERIAAANIAAKQSQPARPAPQVEGDGDE